MHWIYYEEYIYLSYERYFIVTLKFIFIILVNGRTIRASSGKRSETFAVTLRDFKS